MNLVLANRPGHHGWRLVVGGLMARFRNREEVVNTQLAIVISRLGVKADAETIHVHGIHRPDVLFQMRGLRVVIEGKFADNPSAESDVLEDARRRVRSGLAHIAAAAIYPLELRTTPTTEMIAALSAATLRFRIVAETHESAEWYEGTPAALMDALRRAQEALTQDDIVAKTAESLSTKIEAVANLWAGQTGPCDRLSALLGITAPKGETAQNADARRETVAKVSALVLANAMIFQEQVAASDERVSTLRTVARSADILGAFADHWQWIWKNINYVPIFQLSERILLELPSNGQAISAVKSLLSESISICSQQTALRHDLMGRIYHWLLHNAKFLGTYYTSVSAATVLLKLAVGSEWNIDFADARQLADFKVGDLACGTGTLLMASAQALTDRYIQERSSSAERSLTERDLSVLHSTLMQNVLHGYDVLPTAVHLTASTLAMLAPEVAFRHMNLFVMPLGITNGIKHLGSLDFLATDVVKTQFSLDNSHADTTRTGAFRTEFTNASVPELDLCVMNPPFVRSVGGNLLFGSYPDERGDLQDELKRQMHATRAVASTTAGLGSVFVALADRRIKAQGRLAFVLPAALVSGEAWGQTRKLIADRYNLELVIFSHDAERPNFSENTSLSEVLFIAKKRQLNEFPKDTVFVNLWRNPRSVHEALDLASQIQAIAIPAGLNDTGKTQIRSFAGKLGEAVRVPPATGEGIWAGALFAQTELLRACAGLQRGALTVPGSTTAIEIPVSELGQLGELGYDRRDIHDAFEKTAEDWSPYDAFWGHEAKLVRSISQMAVEKLHARTVPAKGRKLKGHEAVWAKAGDILLVERLRTNTHRLMAIGLDKPALGGTWWSFNTALNPAQKKALLLWLNSSLSLLIFYGRRVITEGAWMQMKKPAWKSMPVLDVTKIEPPRLTLLESAYDNISKLDLMSLSSLANDPVRRRIDDALAKVLRLPDLTPIRELLAREPGLSAKSISVRQSSSAFMSSDEDVDDQIRLAI